MKKRETMILRLTKTQEEFLIKETRKSCTVEACGLLFGDINNNKAIVRKIVMTRNVLESPTRFQVNPEEFLKSLLNAEREGMQLIGLFHSHPGSPRPSVLDGEFLRLWPENIWLVISSTDYSVEAYRATDGEPEKIYIDIS